MKTYRSNATPAALMRRADTFRIRGLEAMERYQLCHDAKDEAMAAAWSKISAGFYQAAAILERASRRGQGSKL